MADTDNPFSASINPANPSSAVDATTLSGAYLDTTIANIDDTHIWSTEAVTEYLTANFFTEAEVTALFTDSSFEVKNATDNTKKLKVSCAGITSGQTRTITIPDVSDTMVVLDLGQTLTNKILTAPDINGGTVDAITSLTAANDLDIGAYELRAQTLEADVATGTAPLTVASTTVVTNLNADKVDGADLDTTTTLGTSDVKVPSQNAVKTYVDSNSPIGSIGLWTGLTPPSGWLSCDGSSLARSSYASLFAIMCPSQTCTISIAAPGVITAAAHGLQTGQCISLETTDALPTGLAVATNYWVVYNDADTFWLSTTYANALAGTKITTSGSQSGTHTLRKSVFGIADGTHFYLPDTCGISIRGAGGALGIPTDISGWGWAGTVASHTTRLGLYEEDRFQGFGFGSGTTSNAGTSVHLNASDTNAYGFGKRPADPGAFSYKATDGGTALIGNDGTNGVPRKGLTTRPASVGLFYIIRYQ